MKRFCLVQAYVEVIQKNVLYEWL